MKKTLLFAAYLLALTSCGEKSGNTDNITWYNDIITVSDNGVTYTDTVKWGKPAQGVNVPAEDENEIEVIPGANHVYLVPKSAESATGEKDTGVMEPGFKCSIHKTTDKSVFTLYSDKTSSRFPVTITIANATGPINGIGVYKSAGISDSGLAKTDTDTSITKYSPKITGNTFTETFTGGQKYKVDSALVNITKASGAAVEGNYKLWLSNAAGNKMVTGTINSNKASIY